MRFEDLSAWQKARELTNDVYRICNQPPLCRDFGLRDQIQRAAVSVMSNIAEGFDRQSKPDRLNFYNYAKGSAGEVRSLTYVVLDNNLADPAAVERIQTAAFQVGALIFGLMKSTRE